MPSPFSRPPASPLTCIPLTRIKVILPLAFLMMTVACQKTDNTNALVKDSPSDDPLVGCYTVSHDEPAQIKISKTGEQYAMQMHQFNDPSKDWDNPEPMQVLNTNDSELTKYFDIKKGESQYFDKVIARPDRVFVLAKITDSFASINPQYDSSYLGYIYKGSNTVYKVSCSGGKAV